MKISGLDREFFQLMFGKLYQERWKSAGKSQENFAAEINKRTEYSYTKQTVSDWLRGKKLPSDKALDAICDILETEKTAFQPLAYGFYSRYSPDHADWENGQLERIAKNEFGIDLDFFKGLRNIIPDFDSRFPLNSPLRYEGYDWKGKEAYLREAHKELSKTGIENRPFQLNRDGKAIILTKWDMKIICLIQLRVCKYVCKLMDKISANMTAYEKSVNLRFMEKNPFNEYMEENKPIEELEDDELQELDPLGMYIDEELTEYDLQCFAPWGLTEEEKNRYSVRKTYTLEELEQLIKIKDEGIEADQRSD